MARQLTPPFASRSPGSGRRIHLESGRRFDDQQHTGVSDVASPSGRDRGAARRSGPTPVAWLLMFMGVATFAPAVILPEWRSYELLKASEQVELHRLQTLQLVVNQQRRALRALQSDPAVLVRLAKRDLGYREPGTDEVVVAAGHQYSPSRETFTSTPIRPPEILRPLLAKLPVLNYDAVFCDEATRPIVMVMSLALMLSAIWLSAQPFTKTEGESPP